MDFSNEFSSESSSSSGLEDGREEFQVKDVVGMIQPYSFEPVEETDSEGDDMLIDHESYTEGECL
jgi:hypothetical protein